MWFVLICWKQTTHHTDYSLWTNGTLSQAKVCFTFHSKQPWSTTLYLSSLTSGVSNLSSVWISILLRPDRPGLDVKLPALSSTYHTSVPVVWSPYNHMPWINALVPKSSLFQHCTRHSEFIVNCNQVVEIFSLAVVTKLIPTLWYITNYTFPYWQGQQPFHGRCSGKPCR